MATKSSTKSAKRKSTSAGPRRSGTLSTAASRQPDVATAAPVSAPAPEPEISEEAQVAASDTSGSQDGADDERLRRPDLIEAVAKRVSLKRSEAKMVFDVVLDEIGKALDGSDEVIVPPLGKIMVKKRMEKPGGTMLTLKLKRSDEDPAAGDVGPLAEAEEDS